LLPKINDTWHYVNKKKYLMASVEEIITRMIHAVGARNQQDLIVRAGFTPGLPSKWRARDKVSGDSIVDICLRFGVNVQWLAEGKGPMIWGAPTGGGMVSEPEPPTCTLKERLEVAWEVADEDAKDTALYALEKSARRSSGKGGGECDLRNKKSA
jgi:hypothetical protein